MEENAKRIVCYCAWDGPPESAQLGPFHLSLRCAIDIHSHCGIDQYHRFGVCDSTRFSKKHYMHCAQIWLAIFRPQLWVHLSCKGHRNVTVLKEIPVGVYRPMQDYHSKPWLPPNDAVVHSREIMGYTVYGDILNFTVLPLSLPWKSSKVLLQTEWPGDKRGDKL